MEIYLIRHGMTKGNEEKRYIGRTDEPLSERGIRSLAQGREYPKVSHLFSSPMLRCLETCKLLFPSVEPKVIPAFAEIDFGEFEGKNYQELSGDEKYQDWIDSGGTIPFPGGEAREDFIRRSVLGFREMLKQVQELQGEVRLKAQETSKACELQEAENWKVALVAHGGTIMAILSQFHGGDYFDYQIANGEGFRISVEWGRDGARITEAIKQTFESEETRQAR